jgi:hypothetical protein
MDGTASLNGGSFPPNPAVTIANGADVGLGATTDVEAAGDGSAIAILKRQRTLLGTIIVLLAAGLPAALVAGRLQVNSLIADQAASSNNPGEAVSLGNSLGKTAVLKTGSLTTTAVTADQVVLTYTVTGGKTFYLEYVEGHGRLTTLSATAVILGTLSIETPSGTKVITHSLVNGTTEFEDQVPVYHFSEPIPIAAAAVIRCVTTPAAATSTLWVCNFGGYEK